MSCNGVFKGYYADVCLPAIFFFERQVGGRMQRVAKAARRGRQSARDLRDAYTERRGLAASAAHAAEH
jgi:hypothetical protein